MCEGLILSRGLSCSSVEGFGSASVAKLATYGAIGFYFIFKVFVLGLLAEVCAEVAEISA